MEPTIKNGQKVIISSIPYLFYKPKQNDIIAFRKNANILIKRINKIENDKYFVLGDNEDDSLDSRKFGLIDRKEIVGKIILNFKF